LLYLDDLIASAQKIQRLTAGRAATTFAADEAVFDAVLFNLQVIGEAVKKLPDEARAGLSEANRTGPARLRDLIAHRYFALDPDIVWEVATRHVPALCVEAIALRAKAEGRDGAG
jgi:uncharacterized protein with HEPN domain